MKDKNYEPLSRSLLEAVRGSNVFLHPRFVEGSSENSEILERASAALRELEAVNPEVIGSSLFGSRLKGKSRLNSDIDIFILVDANELEDHGIHIQVNEVGDLIWSDKDLRRDFTQHFGRVLADKIHKDRKKIIEGVHVEPISDHLINMQLDKYLASQTSRAEYLDASKKYCDDFSSDQISHLEKPDSVFIDWNIRALFTPALSDSGRMNHYRNIVIDKLAGAGVHGESGWKDVLDGVQFGEGHKDITDPMMYPVNLQQAKQWYGEP